MSKRFTYCMVAMAALFLLPFASIAQKVISGRILSKIDQSPLPGATVTVKGTRIATSTGVDGGFVIKAKEGDVLVISGIGIVRTEQTVGTDGAEMVISVQGDTKQL